MENYLLEELDQKILNFLKNQARLPLTQIAQQLKVDYKVIGYHLKKLEKEKIILGYVSSPNFELLGREFIQINISLKNSALRSIIISFFEATDVCLFAIELFGKYDLTIELHVQNQKELNQIMEQFRRQFASNVLSYDLLTINKEYLMVWSPFSV